MYVRYVPTTPVIQGTLSLLKQFLYEHEKKNNIQFVVYICIQVTERE